MRALSLLSILFLLSFLLLAGCALFPNGLPTQGSYPANGRIVDNSSAPPIQSRPVPPKPPANASLNLSANQTNSSINSSTNTSSNYSTAIVNASPNATNVSLAPRPDDRLEMFFYNVGEGDATLVRIGNFTLLIDTGPASSANSFSDQLQASGVRHIDLLILSSWNADKIGGLSTLLRRFQVQSAWHDGSVPTDARFDDALNQLQKADIPLSLPEAGQTHSFGDLSIDVYNPQAMRYFNNPSSDSLALRLRWRQFCAFLPSDLPDELEPQIVPHLNGSGCPIFKWRYHGAGKPTPSLLFDRLRPADVLISVGSNSEGLPSPTTLTRLELAGVNTWRTDLNGSIYLISDGKLAHTYNISAPANLTRIGTWYNATYPADGSGDEFGG